MKKYYKLIRDKIPEIIEADNEKPRVRTLKQEEFKQELLKKLIEEAQEVFEAGSKEKEELQKEIGDVLEVIDYLIKEFGLSREEIETVKQKRKEKRGGFDKKLFLEYTE
jgi:predicted house-cleaning noncanonical NTP pyrophosphatase (MazG superfamily)